MIKIPICEGLIGVSVCASSSMAPHHHALHIVDVLGSKIDFNFLPPDHSYFLRVFTFFVL
jgi:hypothetical protein